MPLTKPQSYILRWLLALAAVFFVIAALTGLSYLLFEKNYQNKIYPGVYLNGIDLSGKSREQAQYLINQKVDEISQKGIVFYTNSHRVTIFPVIASAEMDLAYNIIDFDVEAAVEQAYLIGRQGDFLKKLQDKIRAVLYKKPIEPLCTVNEDEIKKIIAGNFSRFEIPAQDAKLIIGPDGKFKIKEETFGKTADYDNGIKRLKSNLILLDNAPIQLSAKTDYPRIYKKDCLNIEVKANKILEFAPLILKYSASSSPEKKWTVDKNLLALWLELKESSKRAGQTGQEDKITIGLNSEEIKKYLQESIAPEINQKPTDAKFEIKDGRVAEFQQSKDGLELNIEAALAEIENEFIQNQKNEIELAAVELKSGVQTEKINNFGIKEIIGIGHSNFAGSPTNRRHNIKTGAQALNGILIKPDEEFSLNSALGEIDASTGYLPELVIKGNKTIPEYGGGLCQIGTTMFRGALDSGLPITMRRNHSYRVSYYEPAGTDATIYNPLPDLRFINDTGNYILIQSRVEGDNLYFDFWSASDGRVVEKTEPTIYNIVKPSPTKYIETLDLSPGVKKCTERAHNGADAYFDYKVTYAGGEIKEKRFASHYIPWREVCLIGVEKLTEQATTTEEKIE
ncbi:VanW family protein [Candidatus Parcubacteria bacterium]|nr:VanW family protein [Patescibacteria group bacterium]MCG2690751.1 VanW family protein [Candidatus Parcubacteria bacterium]